MSKSPASALTTTTVLQDSVCATLVILGADLKTPVLKFPAAVSPATTAASAYLLLPEPPGAPKQTLATTFPVCARFRITAQPANAYALPDTLGVLPKKLAFKFLHAALQTIIVALV